ncbi:MAG: DUF3078 domain-containing protein [Bacteroidales bacterium]|nr:DUF3078 domain-containing protein [Bacteroidales bacterium]
MRKIKLLALGLIFFSVAGAQDEADTAWKINSDISLMFSQVSFTNWAAGGENNIIMNGFFNFYAGYIKGKSKWENMLTLAYGQSKTGEREFRKSEDKIDFLSTYGLKAADKWYYSANLNFKSQFASGYEYPFETDSGKVKISNFLAPGYISVGVGMEYRPYEYMSFYLSPATIRWIIVQDQDLANAGAFGVDPAEYSDQGELIKEGENVKQELGAYFRFLFVKDIVKNVNISTKLELFSDYLKDPQNIDVNWDTMINFTVNKWIAANFGLQMIYDHDTPIVDKDGNIGPRTQIKELLSIGINYKISN